MRPPVFFRSTTDKSAPWLLRFLLDVLVWSAIWALVAFALGWLA